MNFRATFLMLGIVLTFLSFSADLSGQDLYRPDIGKAVPPGMKTIAQEDRDGYVCRLISFIVDEDEHPVEAYLLVPESAGRSRKCPALVLLHDHGARFDIGKEKLVEPISSVLDGGRENHVFRSSRQWVDKYFDGCYMADSLARAGYVVLVTDALYWGSRSTDDARRWSQLTFGDSDRNVSKDSIKVLKNKVYEGQRDMYNSLMEKGEIWAEKILCDDIASVRLLTSLPYVDRKNIGAFGFSMGGHRCWLLSAFCRQVRCGVALCWMTTLKSYQSDNASDLSMRIQPMRDQMDFPDIARFLSPKPMLFLAGEEDHLFPKDDVSYAFERMNGIYEAEGAGSSIQTLFLPGGHHCGIETQELVRNWFDDNLNRH